MTKIFSAQILTRTALLAGALFIAPFAFAAEATITSVELDDATPTIEGTATDIEEIDLSITKDDAEVHAEDAVTVTDGEWSHEVADELEDGDYVAIVSTDGTELATSSFTIDEEEDEDVDDDEAEEEESEDDDGDESLSKRLERLQAFVAKLQALILQLTELRARVESSAQGPVNNPFLSDDKPGNAFGLEKKMDDDDDDDECDDDKPDNGYGRSDDCEDDDSSDSNESDEDESDDDDDSDDDEDDDEDDD